MAFSTFLKARLVGCSALQPLTTMSSRFALDTAKRSPLAATIRAISGSAPSFARRTGRRSSPESSNFDENNPPPFYQLHPPSPGMFAFSVSAGLDSWWTNSVLSKENRDSRDARYVFLHHQLGTAPGQELPLPRPSALKRFGALFVDSLVFATIGSVIYMVPFVGFVLVPLISSSRELLLASWGDRPSPGRALFGLRCVTLSPPEQEASSLFLRQSLPQVLFLAAQGFAIVPFLGHAVGLSYLFALLAAPLQTLSGSGRTWIDYVANTQVIDEADLAQAARNA